MFVVTMRMGALEEEAEQSNIAVARRAVPAHSLFGNMNTAAS